MVDIAFDTECTGLDPYHNSMPYIVTICDDQENQYIWEWDVDPLTRIPKIPNHHLTQIDRQFRKAKTTVGHNVVFDVTMLKTLKYRRWTDNWDWGKTRDTMLGGHLLNSSQPKDLATMVLVHLGINIRQYETVLKEATKKARNIVRRSLPDWWISTITDPQMPSLKGKPWKSDMWLLRALCKLAPELLPEIDEEDTDQDKNWTQGMSSKLHPWYNLCSTYANVDSASTMILYQLVCKKLEELNLTDLYLYRNKLLHIVSDMQNYGITLSRDKLDELYYTYQKESNKQGRICKNLAASFGYDLELPKSGNNNSLLNFVFGYTDSSETHHDLLNMVPLEYTPTGNPSLTKEVVSKYKDTSRTRSLAKTFFTGLEIKRKLDVSCNYMESYVRFWKETSDKGWFCLHPSLNPTGTSTLRWSSKNPSQQVISKQKDEQGKNLRYAFGPSPGREWWSLDYNNIELRIPAYESKESELVDLFEYSDKPPYFGSVHLLNFSTIYPDIWNKHLQDVGPQQIGTLIKDLYKSTWYQWCKNGGFAIQYGAQEATANATFRRLGCYRLLKARFKKQEKLNQYWINFANEHGYVETIPDSSVGDQGYPLYCATTSWGKISPTIPLNYHVQGTACWVMVRAMVDVYEYLKDLLDYHIVMQVHDELVLDFPYRPNKRNLGKVKMIQSIMENIGNDINVPLTVGIDYHETSWGENATL